MNAQPTGGINSPPCYETMDSLKETIKRLQAEVANAHHATKAAQQRNAMFAGVGEAKPPLAIQHGGTHYKKLKIQPVEYVHANGIGYFEGSAIKYLSRWKDKGGIQDLKKAIHFIELLIELEGKATP